MFAKLSILIQIALRNLFASLPGPCDAEFLMLGSRQKRSAALGADRPLRV